jgi:hypothetical protein
MGYGDPVRKVVQAQAIMTPATDDDGVELPGAHDLAFLALCDDETVWFQVGGEWEFVEVRKIECAIIRDGYPWHRRRDAKMAMAGNDSAQMKEAKSHAVKTDSEDAAGAEEGVAAAETEPQADRGDQ